MIHWDTYPLYFGSLPGPEPSPAATRRRGPGTAATAGCGAPDWPLDPLSPTSSNVKYARSGDSGLGEPGARAQSARDNDSDGRIVSVAVAAAGRTGSAYKLGYKCYSDGHGTPGSKVSSQVSKYA